MKRATRMALVVITIGVFLVFFLFAPVIPELDGVVNPPTCGTPPVVCHATSVYLISPTHYLLGVGGYFRGVRFWGNGTVSSQWHYGFDL